MPLSVLNFISPFEKLYGYAPNNDLSALLGVYVTFPHLNFNPELILVFSWVIVSLKKPIKFLISPQIKLLFPETLFFMRLIFLFNINYLLHQPFLSTYLVLTHSFTLFVTSHIPNILKTNISLPKITFPLSKKSHSLLCRMFLHPPVLPLLLPLPLVLFLLPHILPTILSRILLHLLYPRILQIHL